MKPQFHTNTLVAKDIAIDQFPIKVCMYVLGTSRTDVRVMREAVSLVEAGFAVSIVDVESGCT